MKRTEFSGDPCPIARTTDVMGDWWTPIVLREAMFGCTRFEQFQSRLHCSRATLAARLLRLVETGFLSRTEYQTKPVRFEYSLTEKGRDFFSVLAAMWSFGERWLFAESDTPFLMLANRSSGERIAPVVVDERTGEPITIGSTRVRRRRPVEAPEDQQVRS